MIALVFELAPRILQSVRGLLHGVFTSLLLSFRGRVARPTILHWEHGAMSGVRRNVGAYGAIAGIGCRRRKP